MNPMMLQALPVVLKMLQGGKLDGLGIPGLDKLKDFAGQGETENGDVLGAVQLLVNSAPSDVEKLKSYAAAVVGMFNALVALRQSLK